MTEITTNVSSEIGEVEGIILHTPGSEVENMNPSNAERALYSDILNLSVAKLEYEQLNKVLNKITKTYQVKDLLTEALKNEKAKKELILNICQNEKVNYLAEQLIEEDSDVLAKKIIEGIPLEINSLTAYLADERNSLRPLHNFFFTRDASMSFYNNVLIGKMANKVRERETLVMETIFKHSGKIKTSIINPNREVDNNKITIEGGDVLIAREDILIMGCGVRTTSQGIDFVINNLKKYKKRHYIVVQQLPDTPESFIHLDMVFTLLDRYKCMVYSPIILEANKYQTILITLDNGEVKKIEKQTNILECLKNLNMPLKPIFCGGKKDLWIQEREQWHSGANFFAVAPGKIIGYARNVYTAEELNNNGFEIITAQDVITNKVNPNDYEKYLITISGSELARGGGGARCMTMPIKRKKVEY